MKKHHILDHLRSAATTAISALVFILSVIASNDVGLKLLTDLYHGNLEALSLVTLWGVLTRLLVSLGISWLLPQYFPKRTSNPVIITPINPQEDLTNAP